MLGKGRGYHSPVFWGLCGLLLACFCFGGSARADVGALIFLRPLAIVLLGFGLVRLTIDDIRAHAFAFSLAFVILGMLLLQLVPLPPVFWQALPGRDLVAQIDQTAGLGTIWRPFSLVPSGTRNAFFAALVPFAALVLGSQLSHRERRLLLPVILLAIGVTALIGLLQTLGPAEGPLYFYAITNNGASVGIFANRNHQAVLLAIALPMLWVFLSQNRLQRYLGVLLGIFIGLLVLVTGSRSGLLCAILALVLLPFLTLKPADQPIKSTGQVLRVAPWILLTGLGLIFAGFALWLGRAIAWERLQESTAEGEWRLAALPVVRDMIMQYFPAGGGAGSFAELYQRSEPDSLLTNAYFNHAHNDWLEVLVTDGVAGAAILLAAVLAYCRGVKRALASGLFPRDRGEQYQRLGLVVVALLALASISDYPLRTPFLACVFVLAVLWMPHSVGGRISQEPGLPSAP
ncbi:O-antigen polymerase family protein [Caenibius tardaugens NBRC 16725]|uniref:O-antigen polymerase family protein n=1 Tax=Caenibius tardaugens NBRC 16725 TaxID=1219035 RepID=U2YBK0_9SPHN|nr:O-antigen polymerase family protein [Caenibius tardaugens NBRC 16725]